MEVCTGSQDGCVSGGLPFSIDIKGRENVVGICFMIARGVLESPSMPKGEIVDQWLSLISTQAAPGATPIFHGNFDLPNYYIMSQGYFLWFLLFNMFPLIYGSPRNSSRFERYSCLKLVTPVSGLKPHGVVANNNHWLWSLNSQ